jgi:hypothetical protein
MAVLLTISETLSGAAVSDALAAGGTGIDLGSCVNSQFAPIIDKSANTGAQDVYIRHDAVDDPITDVKLFLQQYGVGTGFTYGGADSAANDFTSLVNLGNASGSSKNNADGLSGGIWVDMDWDASTVNQFDQANFPALVKIFGDGGTDGVDLASAFEVNSAAMVYDNASVETAASAPVTGQIGVSGDTALGDHAHLKFRIYLPDAFAQGGIYQSEIVVAYSYTSILIAGFASVLLKLLETPFFI